jgi:hypothetical protein
MVSFFLVFAFGSRGDVLPIFTILSHWNSRCNDQYLQQVQYIVVTHGAHELLCRHLFLGWSQIEFVFIEKNILSGAADVNGSDVFDFYSFSYFGKFCHQFIEQFLAKNSRNTLDLILLNLFSLEGYILSSYFDCFCCIVHPTFPMSKRNRTEIIKRLNSDNCIWQYLKDLPEFTDTAGTNFRSPLSLSLVLDWLWPVTSAHFDTVRNILDDLFLQYSIPISGIMFSKYAPWIVIGESPTALGAMDTSSPPLAITSPHFLVAGHIINRSINFGCSSSVPVESSSVSSIGVSLSADNVATPLVNLGSIVATDWITHWCQADPSPIVCIDFGSATEVIMCRFDIEPFIHALFQFRRDCCRRDKPIRFIFVSHECFSLVSHAVYQVLQEMNNDSTVVSEAHSVWQQQAHLQQPCTNKYRDYSASEMTPRLDMVIVAGDVSHLHVLPRCVSLIHHGGVGTFSTCMTVGIPQSTKCNYVYDYYSRIGVC